MNRTAPRSRARTLLAGVVLAASLASILPSGAYAAATDLLGEGAGALVGGMKSSSWHPGAVFLVKSVVPANYNAFLQTEADSTDPRELEYGYNTGASPEFHTVPSASGCCTKAIQLKDIPVVTIGGFAYREFLLDINEPSAAEKSPITLAELRFFVDNRVDAQGTLTSYDGSEYTLQAEETAGASGGRRRGGGSSSPTVTPLEEPLQAVWDMRLTGATLNIDRGNPNSGTSNTDVVVLIPSEVFGANEDAYVYLYNRFENASGGYEEWGVADPFTPVADDPEINRTVAVIIPEPWTLPLVAAGLAGLLLLARGRTTPDLSPERRVAH